MKARLAAILLPLTFLAMLAWSCSDDDADGAPVAFHVGVTDVKAYTATVTVTHNGTNRDAYYGFFVEGAVADVDAAIGQFLSGHDGTARADYQHYQRKAVFQVSGLSPQKSYTYVVFGMDDAGNVYGTPATVEFSTTKSDVVAAWYPNWTIAYRGHAVRNDYDYSLVTVNVEGAAEERFFLATYEAGFPETFDHVDEFLVYAVTQFNEKSDDNEDFWFEDSQVRTGSTNFYRSLAVGDYVSYAIGVNADGSPTGHYVKTDVYHVDKYPAEASYANLIDNLWYIKDEDEKIYIVDFTERVVNRSLLMRGWGNYTEYSLVVTFNRSNASLAIAPQHLADETTFNLSDRTLTGSLDFRGAYYDADSKLQYTKSVTQLAWATLAEDGSYNFEPSFNVTLPDGELATELGLMFVLTRDDGISGIARMMFPFVMKKVE